jgi:hypothetical protein
MDVAHEGGVIAGVRVREHGDSDSDTARRERPLASIDNTFSFLFTKASLCRALKDVGFTSVFECHAPFDPTKPRGRLTLVAAKGKAAEIATYPWINGKSEDEIASFLSAYDEKVRLAYPEPADADQKAEKYTAREVAKGILNGLLRPLGLEIRRRQG